MNALSQVSFLYQQVTAITSYVPASWTGIGVVVGQGEDMIEAAGLVLCNSRADVGVVGQVAVAITGCAKYCNPGMREGIR